MEERGFWGWVIELAAGLGWALLILGVFVFVQFILMGGGHAPQKLNRAYTDLIVISTQMNNVFVNEDNYGIDGTSLVAFVIGSANVPPDMVDGTRLSHVLGGEVDIISRGELFEIVYKDLLLDDCINMIARTGADTQGGGLENIRIGENSVPLALPITLLQAQEVCYDGVSVGWLFGK